MECAREVPAKTEKAPLTTDVRDWLLTIPFLIAFGLVLAIFEPLQWIALGLGRRRHEQCIVWLNRCLLWTLKLTGTRVRVVRHAHLPAGRPLIVLSNHQSMFDVPILHSALADHYPRFIAKKELARWLPSVSFNLRHGQNAVIDRRNPMQAMAEIRKLSDRMKTGKFAAICFPEGTRARSGVLKKFHAAGVAMLLQNLPDAPVVPVTLDGSWKLAAFGCRPVPRRVEITVVIGSPLARASDDARSMVRQAYGTVDETLSAIRREAI